MYKKLYLKPFFLLLVCCQVLLAKGQPDTHQWQIHKQLLQLTKEMESRPFFTRSVVCASNTGWTFEEALHSIKEDITTGNWPCCETTLHFWNKKIQTLTLRQRLDLQVAEAQYFNEHQWYDSAEKLAVSVNEEAGRLSLPREKLKALLLLSDGGLRTRNISGAYRWADTAMQLARKIGDGKAEEQALLQTGYCARRNFTALAQRSFPYYARAIELAESNNDSFNLFFGNLYTGIDYVELGKINTALPYFKKALTMVSALHYIRAAYISYVALAYIDDAAGLTNEALALYRKALEIAEWANLPYSLQNTYTYIGNIFMRQKRYDSALIYANRVGTVKGVDSFFTNVAELKANIYREMGQYKTAADLYPKALSWTEENSLYRIQDQLSNYEAVLETKEKELQVEEEKKRSTRLAWMSGGTALLLTGLALAYLVQRRTQKKLASQNFLIEKQRQALEISLSEKEILLKEVHHRVKNNLVMMSGLLQLQAESVQNEEAKMAIREGQNRIQSIALLHQRLYTQTNLGSIDFANFANDLVREIGTVLKRPETCVKTDIQIPQFFLDIDTAIPLGLILNELLTNSFKYAFSPDREGKISICLTASSPGNYKLHYRDNGPGLPAGFKIEKDTSFGLRLVYRLAAQLSGKACYQDEEDHLFIIQFKDALTRNKEA
jgi:two-component sensor histidine kinase